MKNLGFRLLYLITALVVLANTVVSVKNELFTDINHLPEGTLAFSVENPSGSRTMNVYVISNNLGNAVRGEIVDEKESYNIFWQTGIDSVDVHWADDKNVVINNIPLDASDKFGYDCRRGTSLFDEGSLVENFVDPDGEGNNE